VINKLDKLKELFATKTQITNGLVALKDGDYCFCAEGVLSLAADSIPFMHNGNAAIRYAGVKYTMIIPNSIYQELNIPRYLSKQYILDHKDRLNLTEVQIHMLIDFLPSCGATSTNWAGLNDNYEFTFDQFSILLDILNEDL
jgi:hypothetical protein